MITDRTLGQLRQRHSDKSVEDLLRAFIKEEFPGRTAVASSFGAESAPLLSLVASIDPETPVLFINTGMLFDETLDYVRQLSEQLKLTNVKFVEPDPIDLESEDPENALWMSNPDQCCLIRKVVSFRKAIAEYDCWISGLKRAHGNGREAVEVIELEDNRIKLNPLCKYSSDEIMELFLQRGLPHHPLRNHGFKSIGCVPCTRRTLPGEDPRSGRWPRGAKTECGIHSILHARSTKKGQTMEVERHHSFYRRSWFVTGACGTVGSELLKQIALLEPRQVVAIDNNESETFFTREAFAKDPRFSIFVCDLRDKNDLASRMQGAEIVLHAAALKHVILCEQSPMAAVTTNISGTQNVIECAQSAGVERLLFTSSDKAVNPTNVMGTSKLMAERLVSAANAFSRKGKQIFASTRFGNVLGSRGSVVPLFRRQIASGGPVTLTDAEMTRFIMSLSQAVSLVLDSVFLARGGEVFITKMPVVRIIDLAHAMIEELAPTFGYRPADIAIEEIGSKPGEKLYEELMNEEEVRRALELPNYFVITPALRSTYRDIDYVYPDLDPKTKLELPYNSRTATAMRLDEVRAYLNSNPELLRG